MEIIADAMAVQPSARLPHGVAVLDAIDDGRFRHRCWYAPTRNIIQQLRDAADSAPGELEALLHGPPAARHPSPRATPQPPLRVSRRKRSKTSGPEHRRSKRRLARTRIR